MKYPMSMTAFGRGELNDTRGWTVEIRSVNHRYSDIRIKLPRQYTALEERIKRETNTFFNRGHIEICAFPLASQSESKQLTANLPLARQYRNCLLEIKNDLNLPSCESELTLIASFPNVIYASEVDEDLEEVWSALKVPLHQALDGAQEMREREGVSLKNDLLSRLEAFAETTRHITDKAPLLVSQKQKSLEERLAKLLAEVEIDPLRLAQEVAILADKGDVTEELVRLSSHIEQFRHFLELQEPVGRRLDFLLQEFLREINTMASKIADAEIAHLAVELKNEVEKMREQVQNLE